MPRKSAATIQRETALAALSVLGITPEMLAGIALPSAASPAKGRANPTASKRTTAGPKSSSTAKTSSSRKPKGKAFVPPPVVTCPSSKARNNVLETPGIVRVLIRHGKLTPAAVAKLNRHQGAVKLAALWNVPFEMVDDA